MITGKCANCLTDIVRFDQEKQRPVKMDNFREHWILLSDGSKMRVGICKDCKKDIKDDKKKKAILKKVIKNHQDHWKEEIDNEDGIKKAQKTKMKAEIDLLDAPNSADTEVDIDNQINNLS